MSIKERVDRIIADGRLSRLEHEQFQRVVHEDSEIDAEENQQIQRLLNMVTEGKLVVE